MLFKNFVFSFSLVTSSLLVTNPSTTLTQTSLKENNFLNTNYKTNPNDLYKNASSSKDQMIKLLLKEHREIVYSALFLNHQLDKEARIKQTNNEKQYVRGFDKVENIRGMVNVWITKEYAGRLATILGLAGGVIGIGTAIMALAFKTYGLAFTGSYVVTTLAEVSSFSFSAVSLEVLTVIFAIAAILFTITTAVTMYKITGYEVGAYFRFPIDPILFLISIPISILSSFRSQDENESAPRLIGLDENVKFENDDSDDFIFLDKKHAEIDSFWTLNEKNHDYFIGVLDISKYTRYSHGLKINSTAGSIGLRSNKNDIKKIDDDNLFGKFLKEYYSTKSNDYLFFVLERLSDDPSDIGKKYKLMLGGSKFKNGKLDSSQWAMRDIYLDGDLTDVAFELNIEFTNH